MINDMVEVGFRFLVIQPGNPWRYHCDWHRINQLHKAATAADTHR